jgi:hypothetical protein
VRFSRERKPKVFRSQKLYVLTALICGFPQRVLRVVFRSLPLEPVADCSIPMPRRTFLANPR